jgi:hypothetical protein
LPTGKGNKVAKTSNKRKHIRFQAEPGTIAEMQIDAKTKKFKPDYKGMVMTESQKGCSFIVTFAPDLIRGDRVRIAVGSADPVLAEIRWAVSLDEDVQKFGVQFLE